MSELERGPGCHPERSEGSLRPASQTLRCAQGDRPDLHMSIGEAWYRHGGRHALAQCCGPGRQQAFLQGGSQEGAILHVAIPTNSKGNWTDIDSPVTNNNPAALVNVTLDWNLRQP